MSDVASRLAEFGRKIAAQTPNSTSSGTSGGKARGTKSSRTSPPPRQRVRRKDNHSTERSGMTAASIRDLQLEQLMESPYQPRKRALCEADLEDLMLNLKANGQITPVIVQRTPEDPQRYYVHAGHRRCAALRFLGVTTAKAIVRDDLDERAARKLALVDNLGRSDLTAFEQAFGLHDYMQAFGLGVTAAAEELGLKLRTAQRLCSILDASEELKNTIREASIAAKPAELLVKLEACTNRRRSRGIVQRYLDGVMTSADLERALTNMKSTGKPPSSVEPRTRHDVVFSANDRRVGLTITVRRDHLSADKRSEILDAIGQFLYEIDAQPSDIVPTQAG